MCTLYKDSSSEYASSVDLLVLCYTYTSIATEMRTCGPIVPSFVAVVRIGVPTGA